MTTSLVPLYSSSYGNRFRSNILRVPTFIIKRIRRIDKKSKDYKNSGVRFIYKSVTSSYASPAILEDSKIASSPGIFFIMTSLIIAIVVFQIIKIDLLTNTVYSIGTFIKRLSRYISEYSLSRLSKWQMEGGKSKFL